MKVVYLVHGPEKYFIQARFSILSLLHHLLQSQATPTIGIVVYTSEPKRLPQHRFIQYREVDHDSLRVFQGQMQYIHRIKLKVLECCQAEFGLPFVYVDCDTQWYQSPVDFLQKWALDDQAHILMHTLEGAIGPAHFPSYLAYLDKYCPWVETHKMWNAGLIGVPEHALTFLSETLMLCDHMLLHSHPRYWVEQMALSSIAQKFGVTTTEPYLLHFWPYGRVLHLAMEDVLNKASTQPTIEGQAAHCAQHIFNYAQLRCAQEQSLPFMQKWQSKIKSSWAKRKSDIMAWRLRNR